MKNYEKIETICEEIDVKGRFSPLNEKEKSAYIKVHALMPRIKDITNACKILKDHGIEPKMFSNIYFRGWGELGLQDIDHTPLMFTNGDIVEFHNDCNHANEMTRFARIFPKYEEKFWEWAEKTAKEKAVNV